MAKEKHKTDNNQDISELTEMEKWKKGMPFNSARLWQEMDDDYLDKISDGVSGGDRDQQSPTVIPTAAK